MVDIEALLEGVNPPYLPIANGNQAILSITLVLIGTTRSWEQLSTDF